MFEAEYISTDWSGILITSIATLSTKNAMFMTFCQIHVSGHGIMSDI